jgi:uncharacterized membrane protein YeaQ/YmgE (transglycosylase-associated protein family)
VAIVVLIALWVVMGLLLAIFAGSLWKGERPYGEMVDYLVAVLAAVITGFIDWYLVSDWFNLEGVLKFGVAILEPAAAALLLLWLLRLIRRRST